MNGYLSRLGVLAVVLSASLGCSDGGGSADDGSAADGGASADGGGRSDSGGAAADGGGADDGGNTASGGSGAASPQAYEPLFTEERIVEIVTKLNLSEAEESAFRHQVETYEAARELVADISDPVARQEAQEKWDQNLIFGSRVIGGDALAAEVELVLAGG